MWDHIESAVRTAMDLKLARGEVEKLEKQDKNLKILIEELKEMQNEHWRNLVKCREQLKLKGAAEKIIEAIK